MVKLIGVSAVLCGVLSLIAYNWGYDNAFNNLKNDYNEQRLAIIENNRLKVNELRGELSRLESQSRRVLNEYDNQKVKSNESTTRVIEKIIKIELPTDCDNAVSNVVGLFVESSSVVSDPRLPNITEAKTNK